MFLVFFGAFLFTSLNANHSYEDCKSRNFEGEACTSQRVLINFCKDVTKDDSKCERN